MGIAIVLPNANFTGTGLGRVTPLQDIELTGISVVAESSYSASQVQLRAIFTPANATHKELVWSIVSGGEYATVNAATGLLSIDEDADSDTVTVRATSAYDSSIYGEAVFTVTYVETPIPPTALTISAGFPNMNKIQMSVDYTPSDCNEREVTWAITEGGAYATINASGLITILEGADNNTITVTATSTADSSVVGTAQVFVTYEDIILPAELEAVWQTAHDWYAGQSSQHWWFGSENAQKGKYLERYNKIGAIPTFFPIAVAQNNGTLLLSTGTTSPDGKRTQFKMDDTIGDVVQITPNNIGGPEVLDNNVMYVEYPNGYETPDDWQAAAATIVLQHKRMGANSEFLIQRNQLDFCWNFSSTANGVHLSPSAWGESEMRFRTLYVEVDTTKSNSDYIKMIKVNGIDCTSQLESGVVAVYKNSAVSGTRAVYGDCMIIIGKKSS